MSESLENWHIFLKTICASQGLTPPETEVVLCLPITPVPNKKELIDYYKLTYFDIGEEALTQRLKNIYRKFNIVSPGHKLPQLHQYLTEQYLNTQPQQGLFSEMGLIHIYPQFPKDQFSQAINQLIHSDNSTTQQVAIMQTFAPNLNHYAEQLKHCLQKGILVRILLAWPYSQVAKLREDVLKAYAKYANDNEISIHHGAIANLETLEKIIQNVEPEQAQNLKIRLYDTLPSLAIYRAGDYLLAAPFLHGALAIKTFQLELQLNPTNPLITQTLQNDFELMWQFARPFWPAPAQNWRSDLKVLFTD